MGYHIRKVSSDVYNLVGTYLCNFGTEKYQIPQSEYERLAAIYSQELGREINPEEVRNAAIKFKLLTNVPRARGTNYRVQLIDGQLITRSLSKRYQAMLRSSSSGGEHTENEGENVQQEIQTQYNIPPHLRSLQNQINKQVALRTKDLKAELSEAKKKIKELEEIRKDLCASCKAEADRYQSLVIEYDKKMAEFRHLQKVIEAIDEYSIFKRSVCKRRSDSII